MTRPAVSAIVPTLDMGRFLPQAVRSILCQRGAQVAEIVVVDNRSTDGTAAEIARLMREGAPIRLVEVEPHSPARARNAGLAAARGDVVAFLDADDLWPPDKLARQLRRLDGPPAVDAVSGLVTFFDVLDEAALAPAATAERRTVFHVSVAACLYRRSVFARIGGFDESLRYAEDSDLFLRLREAAIPFAAQDAPALYARRHAASMTAADDPRRRTDIARAFALSLARRRRAGLPAGPIDIGAVPLEPAGPP